MAGYPWEVAHLTFYEWLHFMSGQVLYHTVPRQAPYKIARSSSHCFYGSVQTRHAIILDFSLLGSTHVATNIVHTWHLVHHSI